MKKVKNAFLGFLEKWGNKENVEVIYIPDIPYPENSTMAALVCIGIFVMLLFL